MGKQVSAGIAMRITSSILRTLLNVAFYAFLVWAVVYAGKFTYDFSYQVFGSVAPAPEPGRDVEFVIEPGESTMEIASQLEVSNLIVNKYSFYVKTKLKDYNVYPGTYILNTSMDYKEILAQITDLKNAVTKEEDTAKDQ